VLRRLRFWAFSDSLQFVPSVAVSLLHSFRFLVQSRASLHLEIIALRHQLAVLHRSRRPRLHFTSADRILWAWLSHAWRGWRPAVHVIKPETVIAWHRCGFRLFGTWRSRHRTGRPALPPDVRALIHDMSTANPLWGAPRIHGELLKLGTPSLKKPPAPTLWWQAFAKRESRRRSSTDKLAAIAGSALR